MYVKALEQQPKDAATLAKLGAIEETRNHLDLAQQAFQMAHAAQPEEPRIAEHLAGMYLQQGQLDTAAELYSGVLALYPLRARSLDGMGEVSRRRGDFPSARHYFDQALESADVDMPTVLTHRGCVRLLMRDLPGAQADLRRAVATAPSRDTWLYYGELQARLHDTVGALDSLLKIMPTAAAYNEIGAVLLSMDEYRSAADYFSKAISASPSWYEEAQRNLARATERLHANGG